MQKRIRLKSFPVISRDDEVVLVRRPNEELHLADHSGSLKALLQILLPGEHTLTELPAALKAYGFDVSSQDLEQVISVLDGLGVLEDPDGDEILDVEERRRHESNLRFYDIFASMEQTSAQFHARATRAHVLILGAGGLGAGVLQSLVGMGIGSVKIVDCDRVEEKNFARQFAYSEQDLGREKVFAARDWAARYSARTPVEAVHQRISDVSTVVDLGQGASVVICAIDEPDEIRLVVNEACFKLGVPFVTGGLQRSSLWYWSVNPGTSPCQLCLELKRDDQRNAPGSGFDAPLLATASHINRSTGPIAQILSGFVAMEAMRYITGTEQPSAAGMYHVFDVADGMQYETDPWPSHPKCPLCNSVNDRES
jgi:molybdopterin/thiamine biosynthesis adenylyltransferase